jgi:hypothetical protein
MSAGCALALICAWASPRLVLGQASAPNSTASSATKKASPKAGSATTTKTASAKKRASAGAKGSRASSSSPAKAHAASHPAASAHSKSSTVASHTGKSKNASTRKNGKSKRKTTARGQQKIDPDRAEAIQEALIREHYLSGEAAGKWDQASEEAMRRYQADHGWQAKTVPDSRALISLGLGPKHDHLLNPESAMTTEPAAPRAESLTPTSHSADPGTRVSTTPAASPAPPGPPAHDSSRPQ